MSLTYIAQRLFNTPLALHPMKAEIVIAALSDRLGVTCSKALLSEDSEFNRKGKEYDFDVVEGVAIIPVYGSLVNKLGALRPWSGMTGYDGIQANLLAALNDPSIRGICFDIDSPGGEVAGCFDLADLIYNARSEKPSCAILSESAYSAAYALASSAEQIYVPRTGGVGSIGVVWIHYDLSEQLKKDGVKPTIIKCGDKKIDGNYLEPLSKEAQEEFQTEINTVGELFFTTVSRNRGLSVESIKGMEAACFRAERGVELGLADEVISPDAAFLKFLKQLEK